MTRAPALAEHPTPRPAPPGAIEDGGITVVWVDSREQRDALAGRLTAEELVRVVFFAKPGVL